MNVRYTLQALSDQEAIFEYLSTKNEQAAREVVGLIVRRVNELGNTPRIGHKTDRKEIYSIWISPSPYRVFYRIEEVVVIIHIRHTSRGVWKDSN